MWLYFDKNGAIKEVLEHGSPARTGSTNFEIFAYFEDLNILDDFGSAKMSLIKPNQAYAEKNSVYDGISLSIVTKTFVPTSSEINQEYFQPNQSYTGYYFNFTQVTIHDDEVEEPVILLDTPGTWSAILTLFGLNGNINVQGRSEFFVQDTGYEEDETVLPDGYTIEQIYLALAKKLNIKSGSYLKVVDEIGDIADDENKNEKYNVGDIVFERTTNAFYQLGVELAPVLVYCIQFVTQAEYDAMEEAGTVQTDVYYVITDDDTYEEIMAAIASIQDTTIAGLNLHDDISSQELTDNLVLASNSDIDNLFN